MATNTQITANLVVAGEVPADQNCLTDVNALLPTIAAYMGIATQDPSAPQSQTDSTAAQALSAANNALAQVSALQALIPARRTSGAALIPITTTGDSVTSIAWSPAMPDVNYEVLFTIHGPDSATNRPDISVVNGSRTTSACQLRIVNTPNTGSWFFSYSVVALGS